LCQNYTNVHPQISTFGNNRKFMRTFLITGAGSGIGRAAAQVLAANSDVELILVGRNEQTLLQTLAILPTGNHRVASLDIREKAEWRDFFSQKENQPANLCGVFANAGIGGENHYGDDDRWDEIISINLNGTYTTIMECLPWMKKSQEAFKHIVITSSCLGRFGVPNYTAYCTAKTGLLGLTRALAVQLASDKILVNAICPGWVDTEMARAGIQKLADRNNQSFEVGFNEQMSFVPLNRISAPSEIGEMVNFLLSGKQNSMTGQGIDINNGSFMI
jgi:NAD(P)-dependent dehydrogenase (short-subunit alcohol dehydrogenase family)